MYLFVDDGEESREAIKLLDEKKLRYKKIDVRKNGIRGWLRFEFGTSKVPILAIKRRIAVGYENIKNILERY